MVFSSNLFIFYFLPCALLAYAAGRRWLPPHARNLGLVLVSYIFYGWAEPTFVLVMLFSTAVDFRCGLWLEKIGDDPDRRKLPVWVSVVTNLGLLGYFKYFNFGVDSWNAALGALGYSHLALDQVMRVALPLGISFYTFQSMSYTIDIYRRRARALDNPIDFACYVSMFPQLVAGPIIRYQEIHEQLQERRHSWEKISRGATLFSLGMAKKVLLANPCGQIADTAFNHQVLGPLDAWIGALAYAFQIYFDFSGYSDMAIGLGLILGFEFPQNFDSPYRADSITDFWRRWHMSLSRWLRDYLYISLGGNRRGPVRTYVNLMIVMLLGGLWHGAAWTFVVWGALHGLCLAIERLWRDRVGASPLPRGLRTVVTFLVVLLGWVFFRAESLGAALDYLAAMAGLWAQPEAALASDILRAPYYLTILLVSALVVWLAPQSRHLTVELGHPRLAAAAAGAAFITALLLMDVQGYNPFIYFIF